ncbi:MAG: hypothetical protein ACT4OG_07865 [Alphaproteobacteria bacterium]
MRTVPIAKRSMLETLAIRKIGSLVSCFLFLLLAATMVAPSPAAAATFDFVGRWMNYDRDSSGITGIVITPNRNGLSIRVFGLCRGERVCDWEVAQGNLYSSVDRTMWSGNWGGSDWGGFLWRSRSWTRDTDVVTASFDAGYARRFLVIQRAGRDDLNVQIFTDFRDRYGRQGYFTETRLQRWGRISGFGSFFPGNRD